MRELIIYGAGGFAREVAWLAEDCGVHVRAFIDDRAEMQGKTLHDLPILSLEDAHSIAPAAEGVVGIGSSGTREKVSARFVERGIPSATLVHPRVERSRRNVIGEGTVVCAGCILTVDITLGRHVQLNLDCTIGHDAVLEDFVTLAPGVHVSGNVRIERGATIGTGASIINGAPGKALVIGAGAIVGAQACVVRDVPAGATVMGVPAKAR